MTRFILCLMTRLFSHVAIGILSFAVTSSLFLSTPTDAADRDLLTPRDFAFGMPITLSTDPTATMPPFRVLSIPIEVYQHTTTRTLLDLAVFDSTGHPVAHAVLPHTPQTSQKKKTSLRLYPITTSTPQTKDSLSILIKKENEGRDRDEMAIERRSQNSTSSSHASVSTYLIDLSTLQGSLERLSFTWKPRADTFIIPVTLEESDDLVTWTTIQTNGVFAQLSTQKDGDSNEYEKEETNRQAELTFAPIRSHYLRLTLKDLSKLTGTPFVLERNVTAESNFITAIDQAIPLHVLGEPIDGSHFIYRFDLKNALPIDQLALILPKGTRALPIRISSGADAVRGRIERYQGVIYQHDLETGDSNLPRVARDTSEAPIPLDASELQANPTRYWFAESAEFIATKAAPTLSVSVTPARLFLVTEGTPPYTLAYGAYARDAGMVGGDDTLVSRNSKRLTGLDAQGMLQSYGATLETIEQTPFGASYLLGGLDRLNPPPPPPPSFLDRWRRVIAITFMTFAVLLLGWMAYRLTKQMKAS